MWKVKLPPTGDIDAQLDAALRHLDGTVVYALSVAERQAIHSLYAIYDIHLGEPAAALQPATLAGCANALHDAYSQVQVGARLSGLRASLLAAVIECPLCGHAPATTLDHHLPHANYRALSINPRNLEPTCQPCNRAKGTLQPVFGQGMIHTYFQAIPPVTFLKATSAYAEGALEVKFAVDGAGLADPGLTARLDFQLVRMKLEERHPGAINLFLFSLKPSFNMFKGKPDERQLLRDFLLSAAETYDADLGLNHWKTAVLRSLAECDDFLDDPWPYLAKPPPAMTAAV